MCKYTIIYSYHTLILRTSFGAPLSNPRIALDTPDLGVGIHFGVDGIVIRDGKEWG